MPRPLPQKNRPSLHSGFARCAAQSAYPELWMGLKHAYAPALGVQGSQLIDWVGNIHGSLSGATWDNVGGPCLVHDNTTDQVEFGVTELLWPVGGDVTFVCHYQKSDATLRAACVFGNDIGGVTTAFVGFHAPYSDGVLYWDYGGISPGSTRLSISGLTYGDDVWIGYAGRFGSYMYQNGVRRGGNSAAINRTAAAVNFQFGNAATITSSDLCRHRVFLIYHRVLNDQEISLLSRDPLAPFRLRQNASISSVINDFEEQLEDGITFTQTATPLLERNVSVESTLEFVEQVNTGTALSIEDVLEFLDDAEALLFPGNIQVITDVLEFVDTADADNASTQDITDDLGLTQSVVTQGPIPVGEVTTLTITDEVNVYLGVPWLPIEVEDVLELTDSANRNIFQSVTSTMSLVDSGFRIHGVEQTISFVQSMEYGKNGGDPEDELNFEQEAICNAIYLRSVEHASFIGHAFTFFADTPCARKQYTPFEGDAGSMPEPRLQFRSTFTLETLSGPHTMIVLRNPETDDRDRLGFNRINRETRGGELNVYSDPVWAKVNTLLFTIVALKREKIDALQTFLQDTLGQEIKLSDWTGTQWRGVVTTPTESATEDADGYWTFTFEFEGEAYEGQAPEGRMILTQSASAVVE